MEDKSVNTTNEDVDNAVVCCVECLIESWIMDSNASFYGSHCKDMMFNFRSENFSKVHLVDDERLEIMGMGDINLKTSLGTIWILSNVGYIIGLKRMLIFVG